MLRKGRRLAVDVGTARVGLAVTDFHGILASPLTTIRRAESVTETISQVVSEISKFEDMLEVYVGLPINLRGQSTQSTIDSLVFAEELQSKTDIPVLLIDERLTTSIANSQLREIGKSQKQARATIDQMAAVAILEYALTLENNSGSQPGISIEGWREQNE